MSNGLHTRYQRYATHAPSMESSFAKLGPSSSKIISDSYHSDRAAPIRLTASDGTGLELREMQVRAIVDGPLAFTELKLSFHNPHERELEGRFEITLPEAASVARLAMKLDSSWQEAEIVARSRGRQVYEAFLHKQVDPVLLEASVGNRFRARVYPIPAKGDKEIIISYSEELASKGDYRLLLAGLPLLHKLNVNVRHGDKRERLVKHDFVAKRDLVIETDHASSIALRSDELVMMRWLPKAEDAEDVPTRLNVLVHSRDSSAGVYGQEVRSVEALLKAQAAT